MTNVTETDNTPKTAKIVASANLNEQQVQQALVEFVSRDEKLTELLQGQKAVSWINWHVNKWDSPERFCTLSFGVVNDENTDAPEVVEPKNEL
jgi:hypothetical protein